MLVDVVFLPVRGEAIERPRRCSTRPGALAIVIIREISGVARHATGYRRSGRSTMKTRGFRRMNHPTRAGGAPRSGLRQPIPSHSIASCAEVKRTAPSPGFGHGKRPFRSTLQQRQKPCLRRAPVFSNQWRTLLRSLGVAMAHPAKQLQPVAHAPPGNPPRKAKTAPPVGFWRSTCLASVPPDPRSPCACPW